MCPEILSGFFFFVVVVLLLVCVLFCWLVGVLGVFCDIRNLKLSLSEAQLLEFHMIVFNSLRGKEQLFQWSRAR